MHRSRLVCDGIRSRSSDDTKSLATAYEVASPVACVGTRHNRCAARGSRDLIAVQLAVHEGRLRDLLCQIRIHRLRMLQRAPTTRPIVVCLASDLHASSLRSLYVRLPCRLRPSGGASCEQHQRVRHIVIILKLSGLFFFMFSLFLYCCVPRLFQTKAYA